MPNCTELTQAYNNLRFALGQKNQEISDLAQDITLQETTCGNSDPWVINGHTFPTTMTIATINARITEVNTLYGTLPPPYYSGIMYCVAQYNVLIGMLQDKADLIIERDDLQTEIAETLAAMQAQSCTIPP